MLGDRIRAYRVYKKLTQQQLSEMLGKSRWYMYRVEKGLTDISLEDAGRICTIFGITVSDLLSPDLRIPRPIEGNNEINSVRSSVE